MNRRSGLGKSPLEHIATRRGSSRNVLSADVRPVYIEFLDSSNFAELGAFSRYDRITTSLIFTVGGVALVLWSRYAERSLSSRYHLMIAFTLAATGFALASTRMTFLDSRWRPPVY
jgi:hypothetical protein